MATSLEETETRLDEMQYGSQSVRAAFDLSYKDLTDEHARLFRLLTVNTGPDISTEAAVVLAGRSQRDTRRRLEALSRAHLIYENTSDRWQMHDLVRLYDEGLSGDNSRADHRAAAEKRLFRYYQTTTRAAIDFLWHGHNPAAGGPFTESSEVVAWLKAEHANLTAAVISSIRSHPSIAVKIAFPLSGFLDQWRYFDEAVIVTENALMAARTLRDVAAEAGMLDNLGIALQNIGRTADALEATREAIKLYRRLADEKPDLYERALGRALANLASRIEASDEQHLTASQEAVDIGRRWATDQDHIGRGVELAGALHNQGMTLSALGSHSEAVPPMLEAVAIRRVQAARAPARYEPFLAQLLAELASVLAKAARHDEALSAAEEGVAILRRLASDDPNPHEPHLIYALKVLSDLLIAAGRPADAQSVIEEATAVQRRLNEGERL